MENCVCRNTCSTSEELAEGAINRQIPENIIKCGNMLILALEDIIELLGGLGGSYGRYPGALSYKSGKSLSRSEIEDRVVRIRGLYSDFTAKLNTEEIQALSGVGEGIKSFQVMGAQYNDEILTDWILMSDAKRAIDSTHEFCYKLRGLIRKIEIAHK